MIEKKNIKNVSLLLFGTIFSGILNYAYHPLMLHYLSIEDFGTFESLLSIFAILGMLTTGFIFFLNKQTTKYIEMPKKLIDLSLNSFVLFSLIGIFFFGIYNLFVGLLSDFLRIDDTILLIVTGMTLLFTFANIPIDAVLRGMKKYFAKACIMIAMPSAKLLIGIVLLSYGFGLYGAVGGLIASSIIAVIIGMIVLFKSLDFSQKNINLSGIIEDMKPMKREIWHFFLGSFLFALYMNIDILLAKNIFDAKLAGIYAAVSVIGKFLIFLLLSIETVYYTEIMSYASKKIPKWLINMPLLAILIIGVVAWGCSLLIGDRILGFIDPILQNYGLELSYLLIYNAFLAIISFCSKLLLGYNKYISNYILSVGLCVIIVLPYVTGVNDMMTLVTTFLLASGIIALSLVMQLYINTKRI